MHRLLICCACLTAALTGCQEATKTASLSRVQHLYDDKLDGAASAAASLAVKQGGAHADEAAWLGGLAEYRQGHNQQAQTFFKTAAQSSDATIAGGAEAMLGQLAIQREDPAAAQAHFDRAWYRLEGSDRRQTAIRGLAAAKAAGNTAATSRWNTRLEGDTSPADTEHPFSLQAGAYRSRAGAQQRQQVLTAGRYAGVIEPIVIRQRDDARGTWWLVHCGSYATHAQAASARRRASGEELFVVRVTH